MACDILITGCRGQLGSELMETLASDYTVRGIDIEDCDLRNVDDVLGVVRDAAPRVVLHTAAFTDVDGCETDQTTAMAINAEGTRHVALACRKSAARMVFYSTDYVFDGNSDRPYSEDDPPNPLTVYGQSKLAGEDAVREQLPDHVILRIAWMYGMNGGNFVKTMIRLGNQQRQAKEAGRPWSPLRVVNDQFGNPCCTRDVVRQTQTVLGNDLTGLFHATSEGETTWYEFACAVFETLSWDVTVEPCTTEEFPRPAPRPRRSSLENVRLKQAGMNVMPEWRPSLESFLHENREELIRELQD